MWYPFLVVFFDVITLVATKRLFVKFKQINYRSFAWWLFIWIIVISLALSPWFFHIDLMALSHQYLWWLLALTFLAANYNLLLYYGLKYEKLGEAEPFLLFNPLVAVVIASLFYADERSWHIYVAAGVAGLVLAWSQFQHHQIKLRKPLLSLLAFAVLYGLEAVAIKHLLAVYSPLALYLIRAVLVVVFLWVLQKGAIQRIKLKYVPQFLLVAGGAVAASVFLYLSYQTVGIAITAFTLLLSPILIYCLSVNYLHEKVKLKNLISSAVIVGLVVWLTLTR
ncbi:DMT family transporter [Patescibacteria group bacterium]|nr:DMT family transporter [Patescibacteria group bacterium]